VTKSSSIYGTFENETKIMSMYDEKLPRWPIPYECIYVPTRFGDTHVIACGPKDAPPIILLHAMGINATMWLPNILDLSRHFRIYAIDTIGDLGKSKLYQLENYPKNGQAYSNWLEDVLDKLGIQQATIIGSSMGGWIAINFAIYAEHRIKRLVLLGPQGLSGNIEVIFRLFSIIFFPTESNKKSLVRWTLGENKLVNEAFAEYLFTVMNLNCRGKIGTPVKLSKEKLGKVVSPTLLFVGKNDPMFNSQKDIDRAIKAIPNIQVEVMPGTGHMMSTEKPEFVNNRIFKFLSN
jgi:pimeloyl-ACP methyl ester carboxylesterase